MEDGYFRSIKIYDPCKLWREVTDPRELETVTLQQNKQYTQQVSIEEGSIHDPIMQKVIKNHGNNDLVDCLLRGEMTLGEFTDEVIQV